MGKYYYRLIVFIILIFVGAGIFAGGEVYAGGGGSFDVPQIKDDFNKVENGPAPEEEEPVTQNVKEESGAWNWITEAASSARDWTVDIASRAWDWLSRITAKITEFVVENTKFVVGLVILGGAVALTRWKGLGFINTFGNKLMNWGKRLIGVDTSHPHGRLKGVKVSDKTLADASQLVYQDNISNRKVREVLGKDWGLIVDPITGEVDPKSKIDLPNGLQAHMFVNQKTHEIIIAFRGTQFELQGANDIAADTVLALGLDSLNFQAASARDFVEEVINDPEYKGYQFVLTGHSLGGYLAVDSGAKYKIPTVTFNAAGKNLFPSVNASTLFGPEAAAAIYGNNMLDPDNRKQAINERLDNYDDLIRNYNYGHDLIGGVNYRPGKTYVIDEQGKVTENAGLDNDLSNPGINSHSIRNFTGFDDKTNQQVDSPVQYNEQGNIVRR